MGNQYMIVLTKYLKKIVNIDDDCENVDGRPAHKEDDGADDQQRVCPFPSPHLLSKSSQGYIFRGRRLYL